MICQKFEDLTPPQKVQFIGSLCHAVQSSDELFSIGEEIIKQGYRRGLFDNVIIVPTGDDSRNSDNHLNEIV